MGRWLSISCPFCLFFLIAPMLFFFPHSLLSPYRNALSSPPYKRRTYLCSCPQGAVKGKTHSFIEKTRKGNIPAGILKSSSTILPHSSLPSISKFVLPAPGHRHPRRYSRRQSIDLSDPRPGLCLGQAAPHPRCHLEQHHF